MIAKKIGIKSVKVLRAEGPAELCGTWETFKTLRDANIYLRYNSLSAPKSGGYDKHDFVVTFKDGNTYTGRYDLHYKEDADIGKQMTEFLKFMATKEKSRGARLLLKKYKW